MWSIPLILLIEINDILKNIYHILPTTFPHLNQLQAKVLISSTRFNPKYIIEYLF